MDTEEMYQRGVADAEHGEPHPFYYQHYYHYRRGYDRARRSLGWPGARFGGRRRRSILLLLAFILVAGVAALVVLRGRMLATTPAPTTAQQPAEPAIALLPTRTPIFPTPTFTPSATPTPAPLHIGGSAAIANTEGNALRGRKAPKLTASATAAFKEGELVKILEGPIDADGYTWWRVEGKSGTGWSAQQSKDGVVWLQPVDE